MTYTVQNLRKAGHKIKIHHQRFIQIFIPPKLIKQLRPLFQIRADKQQNLLCANGGQTDIHILMKEGKEYSFTTTCSKKDAFNRKRALLIVLGRLEKKLMEDKIDPFEKLTDVPF